jgi:hypothetical protein
MVKTASAPPSASKRSTVPRTAAQRKTRDGEAEARLIEIYKLIGQANTRDALPQAESLVADHPNFQLAQLVYGDLLAGRNRPLLRTSAVGAVPDDLAKAGAPQLSELREESQLRLRALRARQRVMCRRSFWPCHLKIDTPSRWTPPGRACICLKTRLPA